MENKERPHFIRRVSERLVPANKRLDQIMGMAIIDGMVAGTFILTIDSIASNNTHDLPLFVLGLLFSLMGHKVVRRPTNLDGEPWM